MDDGVRLAKGSAVYARPAIKISPNIYGMVNQAEDAILALPDGPHLYQRARYLVTIATNVPAPQWLSRPPDMPIIAEARAPLVRELLTRAALWARFDKRSNRWEDAMPPTLIAETLLTRTHFALPVLEGLICSPTLRPDGSSCRTRV